MSYAIKVFYLAQGANDTISDYFRDYNLSAMLIVD
jgi:hypothetical protein